MKVKILYLIIGFLIGAIITTLVVITINELNQSKPEEMARTRQEFSHPNKEEIEKEIKASNVDKGQEVTVSNIDLSQSSSNYIKMKKKQIIK